MQGERDLTGSANAVPTSTNGLGGFNTPVTKLTPRELRVLHGLLGGMPLKDIAREMALSPSTISTFRTRLLHKLGVKTNAGLFRYAMQHGMTTRVAP